MRLVPVRLCDLVIGEEFVTSLTRRAGRVLAFGHVRLGSGNDDNPRPRARARSVLVTYGTEQRIHRADLTVLVPSERAHRRISDEARWNELLPEPGSFATLGDVATRRAAGPRRQAER